MSSRAPILSILILGCSIHALGWQAGEYQLKAAFLLHFAKFVTWNDRLFKGTDDPIVIAVLGQNPFGAALEQTVKGKLVEGRRIAIKEIGNVETPCNCQILFVSASERRRFKTHLRDLKGSGVLTVGEGDSFTAEGGIIGFKLEGNRIRIQINISAAEYGCVHISSKLLSIADIVRRLPAP